MTKKILAALLALIMVLSMAACGGNKKNDKKAKSAPKAETAQWVFDQETDLKEGEPTETVDAAKIYKNLTYTKEMFYGTYQFDGDEDARQEFIKGQIEKENEEDYEPLPWKFEAGPHTLQHMITYIKGKTFARVYLFNQSVFCAYTIDGNTITFNPVDTYNYDDETNRIRYSMSDTFYTYEFAFAGTKLTLTNENGSVTLNSGLSYDGSEVSLVAEGYLSANSPRLGDVDFFSMRWYKMDDEQVQAFALRGENYQNMRYVYATMAENGVLTITDTDRVWQGVYFYCGDDGMIFLDNDNIYYYNDTFSDRSKNQLGDNLTIDDQQRLENMDEDDLAEIQEKQADLLSDLAAAFENAGIGVTINEQSGEIALDASVLFPVGEYQVSEEGKTLLEQFIAVYCSVVFDEKYEDFVSTIMVEGHTDSTGDYASNEVLSQNRAESVATHCVSAGGDYAEALEDMMVAVGYSSDNLVLDKNGKEDKDASRRVCFRFIIDLG